MSARWGWSIGIAIAVAVLAVGGRGHDVAAQSGQARFGRERIAEALERYRHEPTVDEVIAAVLATPVLDPARARDAADRARLAGLVPQARADVRRGQMLDLRSLQSATGERSTWASGDDLAFSARLTFHLERLLFASEETALLRERRQLEERRLALVTQVVHLYFERRRLQLERDLGGVADVATELRIAEAEALLDAFTNGAFSRMIGEAATRRASELERVDHVERDDGP